MQDDIWICLWKGGLYTSSSYYKLHFSEIAVPAPLIWIWKGKSMPKIKFFAWLLLVDRLNTRGMLRRRNKFLEVGYSCALCPYDLEESTLHLFFDCTSSFSRWNAIGIQWSQQGSVYDRLQQQRAVFQGPYFMDLFMIGAWCIWKERNDFIFNHKMPSLDSWKQRFKNEVGLHLFRIKPSKRSFVMNWLSNL